MSNIYGFVDKEAYWLHSNTSNAGYVTLTTNQTISGLKTFDNNLICNYNVDCLNLYASSNVNASAVTATSFYPTAVYFPDGSIQTSAYTASTSQITVSTDNSAQDCYLTFVKTPLTGTKQIYMDDQGTPNLRYNPSSGQLKSDSYVIGSGTNASVLAQPGGGATLSLSNYAASGTTSFTLYDGSNNLKTPVAITSDQLSVTGDLNVSGEIIASLIDTPVLSVSNTAYMQNVNISGTTNLSSAVVSTTMTATYAMPSATNSSTIIPSTAWVQSAILNYAPAPSSGNTYTSTIMGNYPTGTAISIPAGCSKFDVVLFGTGGLSTSYSVGSPDASHPDYYYAIPAAGGGAQVTRSTFSIIISKQNVYRSNTLTLKTKAAPISYSGASSSQLVLNGANIAEAGDGSNATSFSTPGGATSGVPFTNAQYCSWIVSQGSQGQPDGESYSSPNNGQLGGGNKFGGISGYTIGGNQNQYGQGQLYGSLSGSSQGLPIYPASPINYGGALITWYISS
jgi:hypothetical protein